MNAEPDSGSLVLGTSEGSEDDLFGGSSNESDTDGVDDSADSDSAQENAVSEEEYRETMRLQSRQLVLTLEHVGDTSLLSLAAGRSSSAAGGGALTPGASYFKMYSQAACKAGCSELLTRCPVPRGSASATTAARTQPRGVPALTPVGVDSLLLDHARPPAQARRPVRAAPPPPPPPASLTQLFDGALKRPLRSAPAPALPAFPTPRRNAPAATPHRRDLDKATPPGKRCRLGSSASSVRLPTEPAVRPPPSVVGAAPCFTIEPPLRPPPQPACAEVPAKPQTLDDFFFAGVGREEEGAGSTVEGEPGGSRKGSEVVGDSSVLTWGLPEGVGERYVESGVSQLFPWQVECLQTTGVLDGRSLVYCAPTSGGKTLVAEMAIARRFATLRKRKCLFIVPYVALAAEKVASLQHTLEPMKLVVGTQAGGRGNRLMLDDVAVCTIERANAIVNTALDMGRLEEVATVVVDELHNIADPSRGYLLEVLLTKLLYSHHGDLQIIGLSATLTNASLLASWLKDAAFFSTSHRPLPLTESYHVIGSGMRVVYRPDATKECVRIGAPAAHARAAANGAEHDADKDCLLALAHETLRDGGSVLVFCATKQAVEATSRRVASHFANAAPDGESAEARASACRMLACNPCGTDKVLQACVEQGVAYHHAGLTYEEREVVEAAFKDGCVRVLCCTSTLAAGVNLPARRVILHGTRIGIERIDAIRYKQAAGRAGRLGLDTAGDVVVITTPAEERYVEELITGALPPVTSSLTSEKRGMVRAIGEAVASGIVSSAADVQTYAASSFLHYENLQNGQGASATAGVALLALQFLERHGFITWEANASETKGAFTPTALSKATFKSGLSPEEAKLAAEFLEQARRHFVMCHDLHLVYHCTPFATGIEPKWGLYYEALTRRDSGVREIAAIVGVSNATLSVAQMRLRPPDDPSEATILRRFYAALILYDLVREKPIDEVARRHQLARGNVQRLMESAASFSGMIASLAESLNWYGLAPMIQQLRQRLKDGVENDIVPLMRIPNMKPYKARAFYQNGYRTVACLAAADARKIDEVLAASHPYTRHRAPPPPPKMRPSAGAGAQTQNDPDATPGRRLIHDARLLLREDALELKGALQDAEATVASVCTSPPPPPLPPSFPADAASAAPAGKAQANAPRAARVGAEYGKPTFNRTYGVVPASAAATATAAPAAPVPAASTTTTTTTTAAAAAVAPPSTRLPSSKPVPFVAPAAPQPKAEAPLPVSRGPPPPLQTKATAATVATATTAGGGTRGGGHSLRSLEAARRQGAAAGLQQHSGAGMRRAEAEQRGGFTSVLVSYADRGSDVEKRFEAALRAGAQQCGLGVYEGGATAFGLSVAFDPSLVYHYVVVDPSAAADDSERARRAAVARDLILYGDGLTKACYGTKEALRGALRHVPPHDRRRMEAIGRCYADPRVAAWMLSPDDKFEGSVSDTIEVLAKRVLQNAESGAAPRRGGALGPHQPSCRAAVLSLLMMRQLREKLRNTALWEPFATLEMPFAALLASLEHQGLAFDGRVFDDYRKAMAAKAHHLEKQANEMTGYEWSMTCPAQCARALFDSQQLQEVAVRQVRPGVVPPQRRRTETRSTCAAVLRRLSELHPTHPLPRMIGEHRMLVGWATKYLDFIPEFVSASDGRVRAEHHQTATNTGRLAVVDPALQTIPHPVDFYTPGPHSEKVTVELRRAFTAPPQHVLIVADYSQIEVRIMAHFSKDPCLTGFLNEGGDVFRRIASKVHAKPMEAVTPFERKTAKTICYGILYGKGAASLAEDLDCEREDASRFLKDFKKTYEGVTRYIAGVVSLCRERGYVETLLGRKRFFPTIYSKNDRERAFAERAAVNTVCQGSAADVVKRAMLALQAALPPSAAMTLQVHDEVLVECPTHAVDAVVGIVRRTMESAASLTVTLPVAIRVGPSWGQLSDV